MKKLTLNQRRKLEKVYGDYLAVNGVEKKIISIIDQFLKSNKELKGFDKKMAVSEIRNAYFDLYENPNPSKSMEEFLSMLVKPRLQKYNLPTNININ